MFKTLNFDFSDAQEQATPWSVVESGRNSNSSKLLCISVLPVRMKKIQSKKSQSRTNGPENAHLTIAQV